MPNSPSQYQDQIMDASARKKNGAKMKNFRISLNNNVDCKSSSSLITSDDCSEQGTTLNWWGSKYSFELPHANPFDYGHYLLAMGLITAFLDNPPVANGE